MTATVHDMKREGGNANTSGTGGNGGRETYPHAGDDAEKVSRTVLLAHPQSQIDQRKNFFVVVMIVTFIVEFAASYGTQYAAHRDGFGRFNGNYVALVGISMVTTCMYFLMGLLWEGGKALTKALAVFLYVAVLIWLTILIAPEITPIVQKLLAIGGDSAVLSGSDSADAGSEAPRWITHSLTILLAMVVTAPGLLFIWGKFGFSKWKDVEDAHGRSKTVMAVGGKIDEQAAIAEEATKVADHYSDVSNRKNVVDAALKNARDQAVKVLQEKRTQATRIMNDMMTPMDKKAEMHAAIQKYDLCLHAANGLRI